MKTSILNMHGRYLMTCNHQSCGRYHGQHQYFGLTRMPLDPFSSPNGNSFLFHFAGQAFKILGFPMMKRHSKEQIAKNPELKYQDMEEAPKILVNSYLVEPFTLLNYLEGTRFTPEKACDSSNRPTNIFLNPKQVVWHWHSIF